MSSLRKMTRATTRVNPYLCGNFSPVSTETTTTHLHVLGQIPSELDGRLLRIGPNPAGPVDHERHHWFVGTGMVHGVRLRDGNAEWYRSRYTVNTDDAAAIGRSPIPGPGEGYGAVNTHVTVVGGRVLALVEAGGLPIELNDRLESVRRSDFEGTLRGGFTAHPKLDPRTGEMLALCYETGRADVRYVVIDPQGRAEMRAMIPLPHGPMIHDIGFTERFVIVTDLPVTFQPERTVSEFPYVWDDNHPARVGLLPRDGTLEQMQWFDVPACFVFHFVNAYDADGFAIADVIRHPRLFGRDFLGQDEGMPVLVRWKFDFHRGVLTETVLDDHGCEFPRFDTRRGGQDYRFCYSAHWGEGMRFGAAFKHDVQTACTEIHDFGPGRMSLEPVFVPRTADAAEDDGYVMAYVYDAHRDRSDVVIWSAQDFSAQPLATIELPVRVPFGFHGDWVPMGPSRCQG
jgi:carotenoid cleavage dioxygenase-like enzyme